MHTYGSASFSGQRCYLLAGIHIALGSSFSQYRAGGSWKYEPGTDCKASGILGSRDSAGEAFPFLVWRFALRRLGNVSAVPPSGDGSHSDKAGKLSVAYGSGLASVWPGGISSGNCRRIPAGKCCRQDYFRVCPCNSQYTVLLAGSGIFNGICCVAEMASYWAECADWRGDSPE